MAARLSRPRALPGALALLALTVTSAAEVRAQDVGPALGSAAQAALVQDLEGNPVQLLDHTKGKPTLIEFWATWCGICTSLQPQLDQIHATYGGRMNVVVVAVAVAQTPRRVKQHVSASNHDYPYLYDVRGAAVRAFKVPTTSVVVMLDANGKVTYTGTGAEQDLVGEAKKLMGS